MADEDRPIRTLTRLFVLWRAPERLNGARHVIGTLRKDREGFSFRYEKDLEAAFRDGFELLPEFPDQGTEYRAGHLFASFAQRIPLPSRPDYRTLLEKWGVVQKDDPMEILARSGGVQATDRVELAEYRDASDPLIEPLVFRVSGVRFQEPVELHPGERLELRREPENAFDPDATLVLTLHDKTVGRVPRQYSALFARLLDSGTAIEAVVVGPLAFPSESARWVVSARRA